MLSLRILGGGGECRYFIFKMKKEDNYVGSRGTKVLVYKDLLKYKLTADF